MTAALSATVIVAIVGYLVTRDPTSVVTRMGTLSVTAPDRAPGPTVATSPTVTAAPAVPPVSLAIPAIGVAAMVQPVGIEPGTNEVEVPPLDRVGWYRYAAAPGGQGSTVLLGHVDGAGREGVFFRLGSLESGTPLQLGLADGTTRAFHVIGRAEYPKSELPSDLFSKAGPSRLVLITCGGDFDRVSRHYRDNVVVVAAPDA